MSWSKLTKSCTINCLVGRKKASQEIPLFLLLLLDGHCTTNIPRNNDRYSNYLHYPCVTSVNKALAHAQKLESSMMWEVVFSSILSKLRQLWKLGGDCKTGVKLHSTNTLHCRTVFVSLSLFEKGVCSLLHNTYNSSSSVDLPKISRTVGESSLIMAPVTCIHHIPGWPCIIHRC